jgi:hypothetical protein
MTDALLQVLKWWNPMSFFWFGHAYSIHFNPIRISQVHGGPQFIIDPRDWGFAEPCCFACSSSSWESEPLSSDQDPRIPRCHTMSGCLDHRINFSRWFQDISSLSSTPLTKITTLYSFGTRGKPTCQHSFLEIQPAEVHDACDALHALCLWHLPGSPECLANALRMPCDCSKPDLPKFFL